MSYNINRLDKEKQVIIIGGDHSNTLGVIRSLGAKGVIIKLIVTSTNESFVSKSKYVKQKWIIDMCEKRILELLDSHFDNLISKPLIICTSDFAAEVIDKNLNNLSHKFICSSINNQEGLISFFMNKKEMFCIANKVGLNVPEYLEINLNEILEPQILLVSNFPCIVKPLASVVGGKEFIKKIDDSESLFNYLNIIKVDLSSVIVQEYIESLDDVMLELIGFVDSKGKVHLPGIIEKIRQWPDKNGSLSYAKFSENKFSVDYSKIELFFSEIGYFGIFDFEFKFVNGKAYFIENNFRIGGTNYAYFKGGVNIPYLWFLNVCNIDTIEEQCFFIDNNFKIINEITDFRQVLKGRLSFIKWIKDLILSDSYHYFDKKDMIPFFYALLYKSKSSLNK